MKKWFILAVITLLLFAGSFGRSYAATRWIKPIFGIKEELDDNVFLTRSDEFSDWVTTIAAGLNFEPELNTHEFTASYVVGFETFADNSSQNTTNQTLNAEGALNFNDWRVEASNLFRRFENRTGSEDTARVPRTSGLTNVKLIYAFNKLDVGLNYAYALEDYRSDNGIGGFNGQALTYQDLDSNKNSGEIEAAFHFWPKTSWLFSGRLGALKYDTGKKSDSDYFDILTGLRGQFFAKGEIEGKIGYRSQNYEDFSRDFDSVIMSASLVEKFSEKDTLTIDAGRTTTSTIYQQNAYFKSTNVSGEYARALNDRVTAKVTGAYWFNKYPNDATEGAKTAKRADDLWRTGVGVSCKFPQYGTVGLDYTYTEKSSNFDVFDYKDNRVSLAFKFEF
jgi:hypothetical protein